MSKRTLNLITSFAVALTVGLMFFFLHGLMDGGSAKRFFSLLGGNLPTGFIQIFCYFLFLFGLLEILRLGKDVSQEEKILEGELLPEAEQYVLSADDVSDIKLKMVEISRTNHSLLVEIIKKACTKFRANKSVEESLSLVNSQSDINMRNSESEQSIIRYIAWAIPSVGFIGTVLGIASSLSLANNVVSQDGIDKVTSMLGVAFDTTLIALILSLVLMFFFHSLQEKVDKLHSSIQSYVIDNLINRIYHR